MNKLFWGFRHKYVICSHIYILIWDNSLKTLPYLFNTSFYYESKMWIFEIGSGDSFVFLGERREKGNMYG